MFPSFNTYNPTTNTCDKNNSSTHSSDKNIIEITCDATKKVETACDTIGPFDVLCGRDKRSFNNIGNRRFRILISLNLHRYLECKTRCERSAMILSLTRELCLSSTGLRFFKRVQGQPELILLDFRQSRDKVGHALRDAASQQRESHRNHSKVALQNQMDTNQQDGGQFKGIFHSKNDFPINLGTHNSPAARLNNMLVSENNNVEKIDQDTQFSSLLFNTVGGFPNEENGKRIGSFCFDGAISF